MSFQIFVLFAPPPKKRRKIVHALSVPSGGTSRGKVS